MTSSLRLLQLGACAGLIALGIPAVRDWARERERPRGSLAVAFGMLGVLGLVWMLHELTGYRVRALFDAGAVVFLASGYGLLMFRHAILPIRRGRLVALSVAVAAAGAFHLAVRIPVGRHPRYDALDTAALWSIIVAWAACAAPPIVSFWRAARGLPAVQRARLRAASAGYTGIIAVLSVYASTTPGGQPYATAAAIRGAAAILVPLLYASLMPPAWLRRLWRSKEERVLRTSLEDLLVLSRDRRSLGERALAWASRLVGADGGFLLDPDGRILAGDPGEQGIVRLCAARALEGRRVFRLPGPKARHAIAVPLRTEAGTGVLTVTSGPFTPVFGADEVARLDDWAAAISAALDRVRLIEVLEAQTRRHETMLRALGDLGEGVVIGTPDRLTYANDAFCEMVGRPRGELLALGDAMAVVAAEHREDTREHIRRRLAGLDAPARFDTTLVRADGRRVDVEISVKPYGGTGRTQLIGAVRDIGKRKRAEEALQERERQLLDAQAIARVGSWDWDIRTDEVTWSDELFRMFGLEPGTFRPTYEGFLARVHPDDRQTVRRSVERSLEEHSPFRFDVRIVRPDGTVRINHGRGEVVLGPEGTPVRMVGTGQDITERREAEQALRSAFEREREATDRLRRLDEMKNALLSAVSHELRTPLTIILGFSQTLERTGGELPDGDRDVFLHKIAANARRLDRLLSDLLDLDRLDRGILEPQRRATDLASLVHRVVEQSGIAGARPVEISAEPVVAHVDAPRVERIVENLLINAARHTPQRTPVWVTVHAADGGAVLAVDDAGPGVAADHREAIFEAFRQGPNAPAHAPGVGIGLSLVARFAALHGGRAWVEDRPGGGASFRVFLPSAAEAVPGRDPAEGDGPAVQPLSRAAGHLSQ